jgi:sulfate adenylyltransferase
VTRLVEPHGGTLIDRFVPPYHIDLLARRATALPALTLDARELADLELIATGAASPLAGFLGAADYTSVLERLRLANGVVWPLPFTKAITDAERESLAGQAEAALYDESGRLWGTIAISDLFERDPRVEARAVYGTDDPAHPGVRYLLDRPRSLAGGPVRVLPLPDDLAFASRRLTPRALRAAIDARGWRRVAGFQTRNPIHRAHEHLTKLALEFTDGLVIHPLVGETKQDDVPAAVRFQAYEALVDRYYPKDRTILAAFPAAMRYAGPREALFHAIARKNYGITHLIVGRDHAGVGKYYGPYEAQEIFDQFERADVGVEPLRLEPTFYCRSCETLASSRTCPHDATARLELSGTRVREILHDGGTLPAEFTRPEVAEILRHYYTGNGHSHGGTRLQARPQPEALVAAEAGRHTSGFILWFTGLSGAGKTTLAQALRTRLEPSTRVEILDGDDVRTYLSKGLGFSKEDRDTNIRRIGFVARLLARNGSAVITAAISPYAGVRAEVRALAEQDGVPFVEVFANADIEALAERDVKGLYRKALAGELANFTGVSDPYEPPAFPDVEVRSDLETVEDSLTKILRALQERGLVATNDHRTGGAELARPDRSREAEAPGYSQEAALV